MSGTIGAASSYGALGMLISNAGNIRQKLDQLTEQASSGLIGNTYARLGSGASVSLDLQPQIANLQTWQNNVDAANGSMSVTQSAMTSIQSIAANFYSQLNNLQSISGSEVDGIAATARDALGQVASLLDSQNGSVYVFAGQDTGNAPVPGPDNILISGFYTQINTAVGNLAGLGAAGVANATYTVATSNVPGTSPFSTNQSQSSAVLQAQIPTVQVGQSDTRKVALLASANGLIADSPLGATTLPGGPSASTGSYMRDLLRSLATIGSLTSAQVDVPGFSDLVQDTRVSLSGAIGAMAQDAGVLGNTQKSLTNTQTQLAQTQTALTTQLSASQDVDMASTLSQITLVQTQMQASYQLIAGMSSLSLVKFLPVS